MSVKAQVHSRAALLTNMLLMMLEEADRDQIDVANLSICLILAQSIRDDTQQPA